MGTVRQDLRFSLRLLAKRPASSLVLIFTLALGIGANTAVFTVINALLLRPLPYDRSDQIAFVWASRASEPTLADSLSPHNFTDIRNWSRSFDSYFAYQHQNVALTGAGQPEALLTLKASADVQRVFRASPIIGRWFTKEEDSPGKGHVAVLSNGLWRRKFASDPKILGKSIRLDGESYSVVGVLPPDFRFPHPDVELWLPLALDLSKYERGTSFLTTVARIKDGISVRQANAELAQYATRLRREYPTFVERDFALRVEPIKEYYFGSLKRPLMILFSAVAVVLLIACVNVANLMLSRSTLREREMAVRKALGASNGRLVRLLLIEAIVHSVLGGGLGLLLASYGVPLLTNVYPAAIPSAAILSIDGPVLLFTFFISIFTAVLFALAPVWNLMQTGMNEALHNTGRSTTGSRGTKLFRAGLVIAEISLSVLLLAGGGLLLKSLWKVLEIKPGFQSENLLTCSITLPNARYTDARARDQFFRQALEKVRAIPGIESAAFGTSTPFSGSRGTSSFTIEGRDNATGISPEADRHQVSPGYFAAMRIPLKKGRDFAAADSSMSQQVVIINEAAAKRFWGSENPIGKHMTIGMPQESELYGGKAPSREIIGIVGNVKHEELTATFYPEMYIPAWQVPPAGMTLVVRAHIAPQPLLKEITRAVQHIDPQQPIRNTRLMEDSIARSTASQKFLATLLMIFAALALALALIGIYAVMSFSVSQRVQEIGVRMALGATQRDALTLILGQGLGLAVAGIAAGLLLVFGFSSVIRNLLYEVSPLDPATLLAIAALLFIVTSAACLIPARRATRIDPLSAIRYE